MTYRGHVRNGQIMLDEPIALPEGAELRIEVSTTPSTPNDEHETLKSLLLRHAGKGRDLPADLAANHDHYAHGKPRQ